MSREAKHQMVMIDGKPMRFLGRGLAAKRGVRMTLRGARSGMGLTQADISNASGINQADISRLETKANFDDCTVATLRRYAEALGGKLDLVITLNGTHKFTIAGVE